MVIKAGEIYEFGPFHLFPREELLLLGDEKVALTPKAFETLVLLVGNEGRTVDRETLMRSLWPDTAVTEANLTQTIWMLRRALGEVEGGPKYIKTVPREGYRFIAPVRLVSALEPGDLPARGDTDGRSWQIGRRPRVALISVAALTVIALVAVVVSRRVTIEPSNQPAAAAAAAASTALRVRPAIAVWGFRDLSADPGLSWLPTAISEMVSAELAAGEELRTVSGDLVARTKVDLSLGDAAILTADSLARIRKNLGADLLVLGSYIRLQGSHGWNIRLDVHIQDTQKGDLVTTATATGTDGELLGLVSEIGVRLRRQLATGTVSPTDAAGVRSAFPSHPEAARLYAEGIMKLRLFDAGAASDRFAKAVELAPNNALIHAALATAWSALGYDQRAREEVRKAFGLVANLARRDALMVELRNHRANGELEKAVEMARALWTVYPDEIEYGLELADTQISAGRPRDALDTVSSLRKLPLPLSDDPRIDIAEASVAAALSDFKRSVASTTRAAEKGSAMGARLLVARAKLSEGRALQSLGDFEEASAAFTEANRIYAATGDRDGMAGALLGAGVVQIRKGDFGGAQKTLEEALAIYREIGHVSGIARTLNGLGSALYFSGDITGSVRRYRESIAVYRDCGDKSGLAMALNGLGSALRNAGFPEEAKKVLEESLAIKREVGDKGGVATALINLATLLAEQGDLVGAAKAYREALPVKREIGDRSAVSATLSNMAILVALKQGDLRGAMSMCEESLTISREIGERSGVAAALDNIGMLQHLEGDLIAAKKTLGLSLAESREIGHKMHEGDALFDMAKVLLAEGNFAAAAKMHEEALAIRMKMGDLQAVADSQLGLASLRLEEGKAVEAGVLARTAIKGFLAKGLVDREAAGREVLASALLRQGIAAQARQEIDRAKGLLRGTSNRRLGSLVALTAARIRVASAKLTDTTGTLKEIEDLLSWASSTGDVVLQFEARLVMGEIALRSGDAGAARVHLETLDEDARSKGFYLIARKAAGLASRD